MPRYKRTTVKVNSSKVDPVLQNMKYITLLHLLQLVSVFDKDAREDSFEQIRMLEDMTPKETLPAVIDISDSTPAEFNGERSLLQRVDDFITAFEGPIIYSMFGIDFILFILLGMPLLYAATSTLGMYFLTLYLTVKYEQYRYKDIG